MEIMGAGGYFVSCVYSLPSTISTPNKRKLYVSLPFVRPKCMIHDRKCWTIELFPGTQNITGQLIVHIYCHWSFFLDRYSQIK